MVFAKFAQAGHNAGHLHQIMARGELNLALNMRHAFNQPFGIGMTGVIDDLVDRSQLRLAPRIHDDHPLGHFRHRAHVMGDQNNGRTGLLAQIAEQIKNLRLNGDIQRGGRLVCD